MVNRNPDAYRSLLFSTSGRSIRRMAVERLAPCVVFTLLAISIVASVAVAIVFVRWLAVAPNTGASAIFKIQALTLVAIGELVAVASVIILISELAASTRLRRRMLAMMLRRHRTHGYNDSVTITIYTPSWKKLTLRTLRLAALTGGVYFLIGVLMHSLLLPGAHTNTAQRLVLSLFAQPRLQAVAALSVLLFGIEHTLSTPRHVYI